MTASDRSIWRSRIVGTGLIAILLLGLFPPIVRVTRWSDRGEVLTQPVGHSLVLSVGKRLSWGDHYQLNWQRVAAYWLAVVIACGIALQVSGVGLGWGPVLADSVVYGAISLVGAGVTLSGLLSRLGPLGETAAFLAYFIWPLAALVLAAATAVAAFRDWAAGRVTQAFVGVMATGCAILLTVSRVHPWE